MQPVGRILMFFFASPTVAQSIIRLFQAICRIYGWNSRPRPARNSTASLYNAVEGTALYGAIEYTIKECASHPATTSP